MSALKYSYHQERGEFHGYVEDEMGNVIYEMHYPEFYEDDETGELIESSTIFEDGFMQDADDTEGLRKYLLSMRLINEDDEVIHESEYKSTYNDGGLTSGAYGQGTSLLEEGGEMDIEEEDKEENEIEEHLQSISDDTGIPVDVLRSYADEIGTDYMDLTNDIPYNGAFGTQEDFAEHLVDNGLITDLSSYLYMTDTDIRILAGEEADARLDGMDDEDVAELAGKSDEYEELKDDLDRLEELKDEIEELEEEIKEMRDEFDTDDATEEETEKFDEKIKDKENELADLKDENETLGNRVEYASIEDFIDDIRDDALSNANDEITEELEKDAVGYFENLGYSQQDLANHSLFLIDYEKLAEEVSYDFVFIEGEDGDYHIFNNYADGGAIPEGYHQMPDGTIMPDSAHLEHGGDVAESNLHMLMNQAEQFEHHAKELQEALSKSPRVDAWVVAKAERAATDLSDITHYLEGENNIHTDGDGEDVIKMDVPLFIRSQEYAREDAKSDADIHEFTDNAIDLSQSGETLEMDDYKKLVPNHMARGGVNFGASFEKFKKQVLPINIETRSEVDANTILKYADLQNVPATLKSIGDLFVVILDKPLEIRDSMEGRIKELLKGNSYAKGGKFEVDSTYTHFAVGKKDGKIVTGWEYKDLDKEDIKRFTDMDLKDMDFNPRDFRILTTRFLKSQGIDPFDWSNWKKTSEFAKGGDVYDDIWEAIKVSNNKVDIIANSLKRAGFNVGKITYVNTFEDAYIELNDKIGIGVEAFGQMYVSIKNDDRTISMYDAGKNFLSLISKLKSLKIEPNLAKGGKVSSFFSKAKEKYVQAKDYTKKQIKDKKKQIALEVIDNTKDKVSGNKQKMLLKSVEQIVEDNYARGGLTLDDLYRFNIRFLEENVNKLYGENGSLSRLFPPVGVSEREVRFAMYQFVDYQKITNKKELKGDMSPIIRDIMLYNRGTKKGLEHQKIINDIFSKVKKEDGGEMARGGATFDDKVDAIAPDLVGKEVPKRLRKDYGKKYNKKEALEAARRIAGSMRAKEMKKGKK